MKLSTLAKYYGYKQTCKIKVRQNQNHPDYEVLLQKNKQEGRNYIPWTYTELKASFLDPNVFKKFDFQILLRSMDKINSEIDYYGEKFTPSQQLEGYSASDAMDKLCEWFFDIFELPEVEVHLI